jgi:hypothetical protein
MTRDELIAKLRACKDESYSGDFEKAHAEADDALLAYINDPEVTELHSTSMFPCA